MSPPLDRRYEHCDFILDFIDFMPLSYLSKEEEHNDAV
jgi:hypothetical protein